MTGIPQKLETAIRELSELSEACRAIGAVAIMHAASRALDELFEVVHHTDPDVAKPLDPLT